MYASINNGKERLKNFWNPKSWNRSGSRTGTYVNKKRWCHHRKFCKDMDSI